MSNDPTAFDLGDLNTSYTDPRKNYITGFTAHGGHALNMPYITQVADNLWHGGVNGRLVLPTEIKHVVSLYKWDQYFVEHELDSFVEVTMYDSVDQEFDQIDALANWVNVCRKTGPVLVHCQAGLNRSSLVISRALILSGEVTSGREAVDMLRKLRSPAVLCNPAFEKWILDGK